jgi:hypothetical protein
MSSRRFPRCTGPDGLIPDAQVGVSPGCLRSPSARTSPAVRTTQSSAGATGQATSLVVPYASAYKQWLAGRRRGAGQKAGDAGAKRYAITPAGAAEVEAWLAEPAEPEPHLQAVLFAKVVLALMLGRPAGRYLDVQRASHLHRMRELTERKRSGPLVDTLLADYGLFHLQADLHWIDITAARLGELADLVRAA